MPEIAKYAELALASSELPESQKILIKRVLRSDVAESSPDDLLRPASADFRRVWKEDRERAEMTAHRREMGEPFGVDETDISEREFSEAIIEEISDRLSST